MIETRPLIIVRQKLRERMNQLADDVATGSCETFEDYKSLCGQIQGLAYAEREILDLAEQMERNND
jgi:hypothetical protein